MNLFLNENEFSVSENHLGWYLMYGSTVMSEAKVRQLYEGFASSRTNVHYEERRGSPSILTEKRNEPKTAKWWAIDNKCSEWWIYVSLTPLSQKCLDITNWVGTKNANGSEQKAKTGRWTRVLKLFSYIIKGQRNKGILNQYMIERKVSIVVKFEFIKTKQN